MEIAGIVSIFILISFSAFFTAVEFAIVKIRSSRVDQLVTEGRKGAVSVRTVVDHLDEYLSVCQFGITITALGIGWLGEPAVHHFLKPVFTALHVPDAISNGLSLVVTFSLITYFHVVVGELAPKTWAIQKDEQVSLLFSRPLIIFYKLVYPFVWLLNKSAQQVAKLFGLELSDEHATVHSEEELRLILSESYERGEINHLEYKYVENIFEFDNLTAKEIMIPRTELVGLYAKDTVEDLIAVINIEKYTRYPIFSEDKDHVIGMINTKDFFISYMNGDIDKKTTLQKYAREVIKTIETIPVRDLFLLMQKNRVSLVILYDEYGGTAGMITLEDILEEIVGEIRDEYDGDEQPNIQKLALDHYKVEGKVSLNKINELLNINIENDNVDTLGGWLLSSGREFLQGNKVIYQGYAFQVILRHNHQIKLVEIKKVSDVLK